MADPPSADPTNNNWSPLPPFPALFGLNARQAGFGLLRYQEVKGSDGVKITNGWAAANIVSCTLPALDGIAGAPRNCDVPFHSKAAAQLESLFRAWQAAGLTSFIKSWDGSFVPRFVRGRRGVLSNHAFGTAFDRNAAWNGLGRVPAIAQKSGSGRELVGLANAHGFHWGGHSRKRQDGMHFEVAQLIHPC
ncbi:M15 family metallopeptidase [Hymenobacter sp. HD11105]